jgi:hypothetical protein
MATPVEQGAHHDGSDHNRMGGAESSPFHPLHLLKTGLSGGRAETGGGMGANYKPEIAQEILTYQQQNVNIYSSIHTA